MTDAEFAAVTSDPAARHARYRDMVRFHYESVGELYRQAWGDSFHFAVYAGSETAAEAVAATERMIADEGGFGSGMRVLDVGCGLGGPALTIAAHSGAHVTGVDIVPGHVETARQRAAARDLSGCTSFQLADAQTLPFEAQSFDHVYAFESGCHTADKRRFYGECARVLRRGGRFVGIDWARSDGLTKEEEAAYIEPVCRLFALPDLIGPAALRRHLAAVGLRVELVEDLAKRGDVSRNWEPLKEETRRALASVSATPPTWQRFAASGAALATAARAGAFIVVHWRARKRADA